LTNQQDCDSVVTLNLTINTVDVSVTQVGITLTATAVDATYQWVDCNNGYSIIEGETSQSFTPTIDGSYAVIVDNDLCTGTSLCYIIDNVGLADVNRDKNITMYPNPTSGIITIEFTDNTIHQIRITDISGKTIYNSFGNETGKSSHQIDLSNVANGIYILCINVGNEVFTTKIVKE